MTHPVLVVTGAGASRNLGADNRPMPLMEGWAKALRVNLNHRRPGIADALGLREDIQGHEFEKNIGNVLAWQSALPLIDQFKALMSSDPQHVDGFLPEAIKRAQIHGSLIVEALNETLFDEFGSRRIDAEASASAYAALERALDGRPGMNIVTTNYDSCAETALAAWGSDPTTGFVGTAWGATPRWDPERAELHDAIVDDARCTVMHLHGAAGWYDSGGDTYWFKPDRPYSHENGVPVVLYPDPNKSPENEMMIKQVWSAFDHALQYAGAVLVIGHSLHDPVLVARLRAATESKRVCIAFFLADRDSAEQNARYAAEVERCADVLGKQVETVPICFGGATADLSHVERWFGTLGI